MLFWVYTFLALGVVAIGIYFLLLRRQLKVIERHIQHYAVERWIYFLLDLVVFLSFLLFVWILVVYFLKIRGV